MATPATAPRPVRRALERALETWIFRARWLMAPFYVGLMFTLVLLLAAFLKETWHAVATVGSMTTGETIVAVLGLIDLSLAGNLVVIVVFSGYENFVSKLDAAQHEDRPSWMGTVDFSGLKMKVIASIVALSAVALLRVLVRLAEAPQSIDDRALGWFVGVHLTFVVSGVMLALMDLLVGKTPRH
jgi:uncharacterized protein (TIGR00645 family)